MAIQIDRVISGVQSEIAKMVGKGVFSQEEIAQAVQDIYVAGSSEAGKFKINANAAQGTGLFGSADKFTSALSRDFYIEVLARLIENKDPAEAGKIWQSVISNVSK